MSSIRNNYNTFCKLFSQTGLQMRYRDGEVFALQVRCFTALAFLPTADITQLFNELKFHIIGNDINHDLEPFVRYFERSYIQRNVLVRLVDGHFQQQVRPAIFPPAIWSVHQRVIEVI